jgi:hypothetical protein
MTSKLLPSFRTVVILLMAFVAALAGARSLSAQSAGTGSLTGTVTDASGGVVPNVTVTATSVDTGRSYTAKTGNGIYGDGTGFGDSRVGFVLGPGQFNWDIALIKLTKITEGQSLLFRTEFYNAFNHPQFSNPNTAAGSGFTISSTSVNPRLIQFGLKYIF